MDREEALRILGISDDEDPEIIRKKYRDMIRRHHPDMTDDSDAHLEKTQMLTQAYRLLKAKGYLTGKRRQTGWGIRENKAAFIKRRLFMEEELSGNVMIVDIGVSGRYYWDPELESFSLFLRSVNTAVQDIISRHIDEATADDEQVLHMRVKLLHLLIQEFVDPYKAIRTLEYISQSPAEGFLSYYRVPCHVKNTGSRFCKGWQRAEYPVRVRGNNLVAELADGENRISFTENELYYIITPMILQGAAKGVLMPAGGAVPRNGKKYQKCELLITVDESKGWDATERINEEIRRILRIP